MSYNLKEIEVDKIDASGENPRKAFRKIQELADNISENGLINPISVKEDGARFKIVSGERRFKAAQLLKWKTIPVFIKKPTSYELLAENLAREEMSIVERVPAVAKLLEEQLGTYWRKTLGAVHNGKREAEHLKCKKIFDAIGINPKTFYTQLPVLNLGQKVIDKILENHEWYTDSVVMKLAHLTDEKDQLDIARQIQGNKFASTSDIFKAINKKTYQAKGYSEDVSRWLDWQDSFRDDLKRVTSKLRKIQDETPAQIIVVEIELDLAKLKNEIRKTLASLEEEVKTHG